MAIYRSHLAKMYAWKQELLVSTSTKFVTDIYQGKDDDSVETLVIVVSRDSIPLGPDYNMFSIDGPPRV